MWTLSESVFVLCGGDTRLSTRFSRNRWQISAFQGSLATSPAGSIDDLVAVGGLENTRNGLGMPYTAPLGGHPGIVEIGGNVPEARTCVSHFDHLQNDALFFGVGYQAAGIGPKPIRRSTVGIATELGFMLATPTEAAGDHPRFEL